MTPKQVSLANELLLARAEILGFLNMTYSHDGGPDTEPNKSDKEKMEACKVAHISLTDVKRFRVLHDEDEGDHLTLLETYLPRHILDRALAHELERIDADLVKLGIKGEP